MKRPKICLVLLPIGSIRSERLFMSSALGRVLAEDIVALEDYPTHPTSAMDGYAMIHADFAEYQEL